MTQTTLKIKNQNIVLESCKELGFPDIVEQIFGDEEKTAFIIEASAGTGKTYTMTYIVLELIMKGIPINKILAITFTEKAAYELKTRIRNLIQKAAQLFQTKQQQSGQSQKDKLKTISKNLNSALENFSQNQISTIHSFAHRTLSEYPLYTNLNFEREIIDNEELFERNFNLLLTEKWLVDKTFKKIIEKYWNKKVSSNSYKSKALREQLLKINKIGKMEEYDVKYLFDILNKLQSFLNKNYGEQRVWDYLNEFYGQKGIKDNSKLPKLVKKLADINNEFKKLRFSSENTLNNLVSIFDWLMEFVNIHPKPSDDYKYFNQYLESFIEIKVKNNKDIIGDVEDFKKGKLYKEFSKYISGLLNYKWYFLYSFYRDLQEQIENYKEERNLITYNDMIGDLESALVEHPQKEDLRRQLGQRYDAILVDEFQDTSQGQWSIIEKIIYEESNNRFEKLKPGKKLFLIGDPKQSIYRFRNADIYVYTEAKEKIRQSEQGKIFQLKSNFRSTELMLGGFDLLFNLNIDETDDAESQPGIFGEKISYPDNIECGDSEIGLFDENGHRVKQPINVFATQMEKDSFLQRVRIGCEIRDLVLNNNFKIRTRDGEPERDLCFGDIYVLGYKNKDLDLLSKVFNKLNIPCAFHKKEGLFQGEEAKNLFTLLKAIENPYSHKARINGWLTDFFGYTLNQIPALKELDESHRHFQMLLDWHKLAKKSQNFKLLDAIFTETEVLDRTLKLTDSKRTFNNYRSIWEILLTELGKKRYSFHQFLIFLHRLIENKISANSKSADQINIERSSPEENTVKLLTVHKSKGLQAPIVFVFGEREPKVKGIVRMRNDKGKYVAVNADNLNPEEKDKLFKELNEEIIRLYYVAATRAQVKLYLPNLLVLDDQEDDFESINNICQSEMSKNDILYLILKYLYDSKDDEVFRDIFNFQTQTMNATWQLYREYLQVAKHEQRDEFSKTASGEDREEIEIIEPLTEEEKLFEKVAQFKLRHNRAKFSYSSLSRKVKRFDDEDIEEFLKREEQRFAQLFASKELSEASPEEKAESTAETEQPTLAGGPVTGNFLHEILEQLPPQSFGAENFESWRSLPEIQQIVDNKFLEYNVEPELKQQVEEIIYTAFTINLGSKEQPLVLHQVDSMLTEMEFNFQENRASLNRALPQLNLGIGDLEIAGFKGFIDLIFKEKGKYYLLDWKSDRVEDFSPAALREKVRKNYQIQEILYTYFLCRRLGITDKKRYQEEVGGMYYIYLRGINPDNPNGVYFNKVEWKVLEPALQIMEGEQKNAE